MDRLGLKFLFESGSESNTNSNLIDHIFALIVGQPKDLTKLVFTVNSELVHLCETFFDFTVENVAFLNGLNNVLESLDANHVFVVAGFLSFITINKINDFLDVANELSNDSGVHECLHLALQLLSVLVAQGFKLVTGLLPVEELSVISIQSFLNFLVFLQGLGKQCEVGSIDLDGASSSLALQFCFVLLDGFCGLGFTVDLLVIGFGSRGGSSLLNWDLNLLLP